MSQELYKCVYVDQLNGYFFSSHSEGKYRLEYKKGRVTASLPGTIGIFVFDNLNVAENMASRYSFLSGSYIKVIKVIAFNCSAKLTIKSCCSHSNEEYLDHYYKYFPYFGAKASLSGFLQNTLLCDKIKVIET